MKYFVFLLFALSLGASGANHGADRTITWDPWQEWAEFRVRTGDRYLGGKRWEHYLGGSGANFIKCMFLSDERLCRF